jgi:tetratricopeptide (TPR) repeat protein
MKLLLILSFIFLFNYCQEVKKPLLNEEQKLKIATVYYNNDLYEAAIQEYESCLTEYAPDVIKQANISYTIGNIYYERLHDYSKALRYYFRIKYLYPESKLQGEVGKKIVSCLERLEKSQDAQRYLDKETALKPDEVDTPRPGEVIAMVGDKKITQGDLDFELEQLPPYLQGQFNAHDKKLEFLKQQIARELLYDSAKRKNYDKDKEIVEGTFRAKKELMAQKVLSEEIKKKVQIADADIELYYKANKDKYMEKDEKGNNKRQRSFQEVYQQVAQDLYSEKQIQAYNLLLENLMKAENVKIYEQKVK